MSKTLCDMIIESVKDSLGGEEFIDKRTGFVYKIVGIKPQLNIEGGYTGKFYLCVIQKDYDNAEGFFEFDANLLTRLEKVDEEVKSSNIKERDYQIVQG